MVMFMVSYLSLSESQLHFVYLGGTCVFVCVCVHVLAL